MKENINDEKIKSWICF